MTTGFQLSSVLVGHEQDVKSLSSNGSASVLISGSRDASVRIWSLGSSPTEPSLSYHAHSHFVNSVSFIAPSSEHPNGLVVSGSADKTIQVFDPVSLNVVYVLVGHSDNVCALRTNSSGEIVSGSWDKTAKVWSHGTCQLTLKGHTHAVWDVLFLENNQILTASANKSIKLWDTVGKVKQTYLGHTDVVRSLAILPDIGFVSASNDASLRIWSLAGDCLHELFGHNSFIYSVAVTPSSEIISAGEDRCVKIWRGNSCIQTIPQPCVSVWTVHALSNGDIAVGGNDGVVRVFSKIKERVADEATIQAFEQAVASQSIPASQVGDLDPSKLSSPDSLLEPGSKEGQIKLVKKATGVEAYQWSMASQQWQMIGQVVDAVGQGRKQIYEGREYDFVIDVEIQAGAPPLKLPFNASDNPYEAAQDFINKHELSQAFLEQIATFIINNTKGVELGSSTSDSQYTDPYTGSGRYIPQGSAAPGPKPILKTLPVTYFTVFKSGNLDAMYSKILSFNQETTKENLEFLKPVFANLSAGQSVPALEKQEQDVLLEIAFNWPRECRFPVIDLLSLIAVSQPLTSFHPSTFDKICSLLSFTPNMDKTDQINVMLLIRILCNSFSHHEAAPKIAGNMQLLMALSTASQIPDNKNLRLALATLFLNLSVVGTDAKDILPSAIQFLASERGEEARLRVLKACGTLLHRIPGSVDASLKKTLEENLSSDELGSEIKSLLNVK